MKPTPTPTFTLVDASRDRFDSALPALVSLLQACVADGASIGWPTTPTDDVAARFWRGCIAATAQGERCFWLALEDPSDPASVVGSTQLALAGMPNGRHRAEVMKVMVHPRARRRGLAEALLAHAERQALDRGRWLLVLDTLKGSQAERLYARLGWQRCGRIPDYAELGDGSVEATTMMFKRLWPGGLQVRHASPDGADAQALQQALSAHLLARFGNSGQAGFEGFDAGSGVFVVARNAEGHALGCGALRPLPERGAHCGELKRMWSAAPRHGIGHAVLRFLEHEATLRGWTELALSTRVANTEALAFYRAHGYVPVAPWGRYMGRNESACLARRVD